MFFLPDGTGKPNEEGLSYYNSLIDVLLEKGALFSTFQCLHNVSSCLLPFLWLSIFLELCIRYTTIRNTLPLGPSPSTGRQIRWLVKLANRVCNAIAWSSDEAVLNNLCIIKVLYLHENWFGWSWQINYTGRILFTMPLLASRNLEIEWSTGSPLMSPITLQLMAMILAFKHLGGVPLCLICSVRRVDHQLNHILWLTTYS